ncbi:hypothetical protein DFH94DRAFT_162838 [Russula ochroleuca]|uniref:Arrestin-like N-terminal domain-containing protein n=1 Tax=Russula ochroleuca TaxID=152965 RepID=A0A9P5N491_9AGAM|nr:hypothetical protein DFH94DRAFT_162838 [Russula ochroleuca]
MTMEGHTDEPPAYRQTPRRHRILGAGRFRHEHRYVLQDKSGRDWVSFRIKSRAADPKNTPLFFEGDTIRGEVQLDLAKAKTLKGLTITVRAGMTAVGQEEELFLDITEPVWTPASTSEGKVVGQHRFPFSITLPRDATIAPVPKAAPKCFSLPPTFSERASPAYIDYRLFLTVRRGRLRVNKQLSTHFGFLPCTVAKPPSPLRALAYVEGGVILGPHADPEGWKVFDPVTITGTLFKAREVSVECTLAVATPFTFASNSPIPLFLTLHGTDTAALDMFASAPNLCLLRTIAVGSEAAEERGTRRSNNTFVSSVASAVFWPHDASASGRDTAAEVAIGDPDTRTLRGELFVPRGSKQSFTFPRFACSYSIALLPPQVDGFDPLTAPEDPLLTESVTITMASAPGIIPSSQMPPSYEVLNEGNYNITTGFLENGNQRFLHHHQQ